VDGRRGQHLAALAAYVEERAEPPGLVVGDDEPGRHAEVEVPAADPVSTSVVRGSGT